MRNKKVLFFEKFCYLDNNKGLSLKIIHIKNHFN